jgi:hypothetical protein
MDDISGDGAARAIVDLACGFGHVIPVAMARYSRFAASKRRIRQKKGSSFPAVPNVSLQADFVWLAATEMKRNLAFHPRIEERAFQGTTS